MCFMSIKLLRINTIILTFITLVNSSPSTIVRHICTYMYLRINFLHQIANLFELGFGLWTLGKVEGNLKTLLCASIIIDALLIPVLIVGIYGSIYNNVKLLSVVCVTLVRRILRTTILIFALYIVCCCTTAMCDMQDNNFRLCQYRYKRRSPNYAHRMVWSSDKLFRKSKSL